MRTYAVTMDAPPEIAWRLLSSPEEWGRWAPLVQGGWGLGEPEVRKGARGAARVLGCVPLPAKITGKRTGRSWTWRVGLGMVEVVHRVEPDPEGGCVASIQLLAARPLEDVAALAYGPMIGWSLRRLAERAEAEVGSGGAGVGVPVSATDTPSHA